MTCERIPLEGGGSAIVCGTRARRPKCSGCGAPAPFLCDWKTPGHRNGTCDRPVCAKCTTKPAPDKDICPTHKPDLERWIAEKLDSEAPNP